MRDEDKSRDQRIEELKEYRVQLFECKTRYRTLVEQVPAITYTAALDAASSTLSVNPQVKRYLGVTQVEYTRDPDMWLKMLHPTRPPLEDLAKK